MVRGRWFLKQAVGMTAVSIFAALLSFGKEAIFAACFGSSSTADAYIVAIQVPEILAAVIWEAINTIVIPMYSKEYYATRDSDKRGFISKFLTLVFSLSFCIVLLLEIFGNQIIYVFSPGLSTETRNLAVSLLRWIAPMMFFEGITRITIGVQNVHQKFMTPKLISCIRNVVYIIFLILFVNRFGIFAAAYGILTGIVIECFIALFITRKYERFHLDFHFRDQSINRSWRMLVPIVIGVGIMDINQIVNKVVASYLSTGSVALLNYSSKLSGIIGVVVLRNAIDLLYPLYSKMEITNQKDKLSEIYGLSIKTMSSICVPLILGSLFLRNEIVTLVFKRGSFTNSDVTIVAYLFSIYMFTELFTVLRLNATKLLAVHLDTKLAMINSAIGVFLNIILSIAFSRIFGIYGLAFATLLSAGIVSTRLVLRSFSILQLKKPAGNGKFFVKIMVSTFAMFSLLSLLKQSITSLIPINSTFSILLYSVVMVILGGGAYVLFLKLLRTKELTQIVAMLTRKMKVND